MTIDWTADPFGIGRAMEAWRHDQKERRLALAVRDLLRQNRRKAPGWCLRRVTAAIEEDDELTAYLRSVAVAGADAWAEEVERVRRQQARRRRLRERETGRRQEASSELSVVAVQDLLDTWRQWGRLLLDAGQAPGFPALDEFQPPAI